MNKQELLTALYRQYRDQSFLPKQARREVPALKGVALQEMVEVLESECSTLLQAWDFHRGNNPDGSLRFDRENATGYLGWSFTHAPESV